MLLFSKRYVLSCLSFVVLDSDSLRSQTIKRGLESSGFTPKVRPLKDFEDDYGLKLGDDIDDDEDEDEDEEFEEVSDVGSDEDEDD